MTSAQIFTLMLPQVFPREEQRCKRDISKLHFVTEFSRALRTCLSAHRGFRVA
jgi:hypothetical protein